jgi:CRISPR-associated protein Csh2
MSRINKRSELLFLYDIRDTNPNGDPFDENKPRIDEEVGINLVTDVRLKRTIRDYWKDYKKREIFIREIAYEDDKIQDAKLRAEDFLMVDGVKVPKSSLASIAKERGKGTKDTDLIALMKSIVDKNIKKCIDVRMFGITLPISLSAKKSSSITYTGPVQFKMGRSLHRVNLEFIKGTGAFASKEGSTQKTFREEYFLSYSLIAFYGIINENAVEKQNLPVTEEDVNLLLDGMWNGTKNLISRSKIGQTPKFLLRIEYKEENYHIGELDHLITLITDKNEEEIRSTKDYTIDVTNLIDALKQNKNKINNIQYELVNDLKLQYNGKPVDQNNWLNDFPNEKLSF